MRGCVPPRTPNLVKFLKNHHQEQVDKLVLKNQMEIGIVEDIRSFVKQKCTIEKSYAESLLKLSSNFQGKKQPNIPDIKKEGREEEGREERLEEGRRSRSETRRVSFSGDSMPSGQPASMCRLNVRGSYMDLAHDDRLRYDVTESYPIFINSHFWSAQHQG